MEAFVDFINNYISQLYRPEVTFSDLAEIFIIAFFLYHIFVWMKSNKAWTLLKGILVIVIFAVIAYIFNFTTILWIAGKSINVAIIAVIIIFQPELRKALEQLGNKKFFSSILPFDDIKERKERFTDDTADQIVKACYIMGKAKTGALIVIEQEHNLDEFIKTGIAIDALVSSQLLINIFEHNTPLHDGAVVIKGNRVTSATCYLPLSDNMGISKDLGTRHRAAVGMSEKVDAFVIIVSEETGKVSIAYNGEIVRNVDKDYLKNKLSQIKTGELEKNKRIKIWKRGEKTVE